ncbi:MULTISPECIES: nucleotide exchange factor GrpE [unclassified Legionella]|uniref:nucleotide exchange factor GrpE n=1 Tax=unclassified Legionella TaxID=2622702 RepID=UPI001E48A96C|nr:nucleotide exchange factor GrpE [Legionella sp. 31fI33]MCC5013635.1 nucleotide exchange factor GrpE [Legionella sp. 31fI33]
MSEDKRKNWHKIKENSELEDEILDHEDSEDEEDAKSEPGENALEHPSYSALEEQLTLAEQKAHENWEKAVRAMAEVDNIRRRAERDVAHAHRYSLEKIINALLPVADSLEQALQLCEKEGQEGMKEGLELTMKLFIDALEKHGVTQINPEGAPFDPQEHEAMSIQEVPGVAANTVLTVFQKGFKLNDRLIRPARVIVAKAK